MIYTITNEKKLQQGQETPVEHGIAAGMASDGAAIPRFVALARERFDWIRLHRSALARDLIARVARSPLTLNKKERKHDEAQADFKP